MEIRYLLQLLREHRRLVVLSAMFGGLLALAATYILPEKFEATTSVLIRPRKGAATNQSSKSMMDYPVSFNIPVDAMSKTYAEIMSSDAVASRVVDALHLDTLQPPRDPRWWKRTFTTSREYAKLAMVRSWEFLRYGRIEPEDPYRKAVTKVKDNLHASPVTDTFLFSLTASNTDPELAAHIANTAAKVFIDYTRQARMDEEGTGARDVRERLSTVRTELESARGQLQSFGDGTTASSLEPELQLRLDELSKFQATRAGVAQQLSGLQAETAALTRQLAAENQSVQISATVARNPVITEIESALARNRVEYAGLEKTLQGDHPRMQELKAQIDEAVRQLASAKQQVPDRDTSALNQTREQINQRLLDRVAVREATAAQLTTLERTITEYEGHVESLTAQKAELSKLRLDLDVRETEYRLLSQEEAQSSLAALQQLGEIRQLHLAVPAVYPRSPIKIYYVSAGFALGLILSLLLVLLGDYTDPRVHDVDDLSRALTVPVIAVVPHAAGGVFNTPLMAGDPGLPPGIGLPQIGRGRS